MVKVDTISWQMQTESERGVATGYKERIAAMVGGELRCTANEQNVWIDGRILTIEDLRSHEDDLVESVKLFLKEFQELERTE
jgi:hypothetical protein